LCHAEETGEYCSFEYFNASCRSPAERIYIRSAQYGRMRVGRCVKVDLGYLGCAADVRHVIEARCSGRPRCSIAVTDAELRTRSPCPTDVTWYLQVSYACVTGQLIRLESPTITIAVFLSVTKVRLIKDKFAVGKPALRFCCQALHSVSSKAGKETTYMTH